MKKKIVILLVTILFFISEKGFSQGIEELEYKIDSILETKKAVVGLAINGFNPKDTLQINGQKHFPMQSVFKFPIALTVLSEIDKGKLSLDQKVEIKKSDLLPGLWSPIQKKYPEGTTLKISEIIRYTVGFSDNVGCDVLLKVLGGPEVVENYFLNLGFKDFSVKINEETMQHNWDLQFSNWTTPKEANRILTSFYENKNELLSKENHSFIWSVMKQTKTGKNRLKGQLPKEVLLAHKTGSSGKSKKTGITAALNDIGIVFLPNGKYYTISVFVSNSSESKETNEKIISDISKLTWDYFNKM